MCVCVCVCVSSAPSYPAQSGGFSDFTGPGTPGVGGDFSSPGPPPLSYQSELSSALLTPDKPPPHPLAGQVTSSSPSSSCFISKDQSVKFLLFLFLFLFLSQMSVSGRLDSTSHGAPLSQQQSQGLHSNPQLGGSNQMMQRSNQNPRLQGDGSFGLGGSAEVPEPTLDVSLNQNQEN